MYDYSVVFDFLSKEDRNQLTKIAANLKYTSGRQGTGYLKSVIPSHLVQGILDKALKILDAEKYDCYILRYPSGSFVPCHRDDVQLGLKHFRLNAIITEAVGGELTIEDRKIHLLPGDAIIFRPDALTHSVSKITTGTRYVFSVGTVKEK